MAVYRDTLDRMGCAVCHGEEGGPLYLHSRCHPRAATWARYEDGVLTVECAECETEIVAVKVANRALVSAIKAYLQADENDELHILGERRADLQAAIEQS
jgi:hypothetical protein